MASAPLPLAPSGRSVASLRPTRDRGKLSMLRCDQCREDKQKCLPVTRKWPTKCDRCSKRGLACSEPKRAERRRREQNAETVARRPVVDQPLARNHATNSQIKDLLFLTLYRKNLLMAYNRLRGLERDIRRTFVDPFGQPMIPITPKSDGLMSFCQDLDGLIHIMTQQVLAWTTSNNQPGSWSTLTAQYWMDSFATDHITCYICASGSRRHLEMASSLSDPETEFFRQLAFLESCIRCPHSACMGRIAQTASKLPQLAFAANAKAQEILVRASLWSHLPTISNSHCCYVSDSVAALMSVSGNLDDVQDLGTVSDCLGRTRLHQLLDVEWDLINVGDHFDRISTILSRVTDAKALDKQDILGRSPLHIACRLGLASLVPLLLEKGADLNRRTAYGMLPLHFAAAIGSLGICERLLSLPDIQVITLDAYYNRPLEYAVKKGFTHLAELLSFWTSPIFFWKYNDQVLSDFHDHGDQRAYGTVVNDRTSPRERSPWACISSPTLPIDYA